MGRDLREYITGATYHTYSRCIGKQNLMKNPLIKEMMITVIRETQEKFDFRLNAFIILDNHFHFIIQTKNDKDTVSKIMQRLKSVFAKRYNKKMGTCGPFWNERFGCKIIEKAKDSTKYMLYLLWYLAYNSYRKGKVNDPREDKYSSINCYLQKKYKCSLKISLHDAFTSLGKSFNGSLKYLLKYEKYHFDGLMRYS